MKRQLLFWHRKMVSSDNTEHYGGFRVKNQGLDAIQEPSFISSIIPKLYRVKWRYILLMFLLAQIGSWVLFGLLYFLCTVGDDQTFQCVKEVREFSEAFLFSLETQTTIGYGFRVINGKCWYGIIIVVLQTLIGMLVHSCLLMVIVNKLSRPDVRQKSIQFSDRCVLFKDMGDGSNSGSGGVWKLKFRIGDIENSSYLMDTKITVHLIQPESTIGKSRNGMDQMLVKTCHIDYETVPATDSGIMIWPSEVVHRVSDNSPFKEYTDYLDSRESSNNNSTGSQHQQGQVTRKTLERIRRQHAKSQQDLEAIGDGNGGGVQAAGSPDDLDGQNNASPRNSQDSMLLIKSRFELSRLVVLFNAMSSENNQPVSSSKCYKMSSDLKVNHNFEPILYQKIKVNGRGEAHPVIEIDWGRFHIVKLLKNAQSHDFIPNLGQRTAIKLVTIDTIS